MPYSYFQSYLCFMHKRATKTNAHPSKKSQYQIGFNILLDQKKHPESIVIASHILSGYQKNPQLFAMILKKYVDNYPISKNKILHNIKFLDEIPKYEPFINAQENGV